MTTPHAAERTPGATQDAPPTHRMRDGAMCPWYPCDAQAAEVADEMGFEVEFLPDEDVGGADADWEVKR